MVNQSTQPLWKNKTVWLGFIISLSCLWLAMRNIPFSELGQILSEAQYIWIIPAVGSQIVSIIFRSWRWVYLLQKSPTFWDSFWAQGIGFLFTNILPLRLGEPTRVLVMSQKSGLPLAQVTSTAVIERLFDVATVITLLIIILPFMDVPSFVIDAGMLFGSLLLVAVIIVSITIHYTQSSSKLLHRILSQFRILPADVIVNRWDELLTGFRTISTVSGLLQVLGSSLASWLFSLLMFWCVLLAFKSGATIIEATFVLIAVTLAMTVPSSPGFIGVFQLVGQQALVLPFQPKYSMGDALSIMILVNLTYYVTTTGLGIIASYQLGISFAKIRNRLEHGSRQDPNNDTISS